MSYAKPSDRIADVDGAVAEIPLLPETTVREAGMGPALSLREGPGVALVFTLDVTRVIERESLDVSVADVPLTRRRGDAEGNT